MPEGGSGRTIPGAAGAMSDERAAFGRGPDPAALALDKFKRELLAFRDAGAKLLHAADTLLVATQELHDAAGVDARIDVERELATVLQMRRGDAFWDRPIAEPFGNGMPMLEAE